MNRRNFIQIAVPAALGGALIAQEKAKSGRLSGVITAVDKGKTTIEMHPRKEPNVRRKIAWDDNTKWTMDGKPGKADDAKDGLNVIAVGNWDGTTLQATQISLKQP